MRRVYSTVVGMALLVALFQAPYSHIHLNRTSDHAKEHHLSQGLTLHTHLLAARHGDLHLPAVTRSNGRGKDDAIFLAWAPALTHFDPIHVLSPLEPFVLILPDQLVDFLVFPVYHSHDPPFVLSSAPRSPPV